MKTTTHIEHIYNLGMIIMKMQSQYTERAKYNKDAVQLIENLSKCYSGLLTIDSINMQLQQRVHDLATENITQGNKLIELSEKIILLEKTINSEL